MTDSERKPTRPTPAAVPIEPSAPSGATVPVQSAASTAAPPPETVRELLRRVDAGWAEFRASAARFPSERMDEHLTEDGWTRKQMLFHIGVWHDLTTERLSKFFMSGTPVKLDSDTETINSRSARQAIGRTAGEILGDVEGTFNRLRRQLQRLTDQQLRANDAWVAEIVIGNTYEHYAEHAADVYSEPEPEPAGRRR
ncbi:MAG TPA: DinB family protein [Candidatus Limnocylindrales bacterium]|nr:DinB family protein [Candidatus Limnocylindrales bacterium]